MGEQLERRQAERSGGAHPTTETTIDSVISEGAMQENAPSADIQVRRIRSERGKKYIRQTLRRYSSELIEGEVPAS